MFRLLTAGCALALVALTGGSVAAEEKDKDKATAWVREVGEITLTFEIGKDTAKYTVSFGGNGVTVNAKITRDKDVIKSEVTDVEVKGNFPNPPKKGDKLSFKWVVKDDKAKLSELDGDNVEGAKDVVEGEFAEKK